MEKTEKLLSIITVCYNSAATIKRCIDSITGQLTELVEYCIIDGGSTDGTHQIIRREADKYPITYYIGPDKGIYNAMNKGAGIASGQWLWFVNSDDYAADGIIRKLLEEISSNGSCYDCIYGDVEFVKSYQGQEYRKRNKPELSERLLRDCTLFHPGFLCKTEVFRKEGGFDERYHLAADWEYMIRLYRKQCRFQYMEEIFAYYYTGGASSKANVIEKYKLRDYYNNNWLYVCYRLLMDVTKAGCLGIMNHFCMDIRMKWSLRDYERIIRI